MVAIARRLMIMIIIIVMKILIVQILLTIIGCIIHSWDFKGFEGRLEAVSKMCVSMYLRSGHLCIFVAGIFASSYNYCFSHCFFNVFRKYKRCVRLCILVAGNLISWALASSCFNFLILRLAL